MRERSFAPDGPVLPRPGRPLMGVLIALLVIWLVFAVGINWGGASEGVFLLLCGNTERVLKGEVWRLVTAPFMHLPSGTPWHLLGTLLGLYFLAPSLEKAWGTGRFLRFLMIASLVGYVLQMLVELALPPHLAAKIVPLGYWFGAMPTLEAVAIAWALTFRGQTVRLMFIIPVTSGTLIAFVVATSTLYLLAGASSPSGLISPFGGMLTGFLLGGGTPSPLRRFWLKQRYARLERAAALEAQRERSHRRERVARSGLRVIEGGRSEADSEQPSTNGKSNGQNRVGPDGRLLN